MGETFSLKMSNPFCTSKKVNRSKLEATFISEKKIEKKNHEIENYFKNSKGRFLNFFLNMLM